MADHRAARLGVPGTIAPDGPTSMSATVFSSLVMGTGKTGIIWPSPAILAASFDKELADRMGECVGLEGRSMGYAGWYAPAMNCHRTPFNSRNFEYYSEDPILAGKTAARVVRGVQAMREIYLKPFELAVREGGDLSLDTFGGFTGGNGKRKSLLAAAKDILFMGSRTWKVRG